MGNSSFLEEFWFMDSLGSTGNFLSSHEEIIGVSVVGVDRVKHSVEWPCIGGVPVQHIEVSIVLVSDNLAKSFLIFSVQIL